MHSGIRVALGIALGMALWVRPAAADSQMFPTKNPPRGVSAYLIRPSEGVEKLPDAWKRITSQSYGNSALANECLAPDPKAAPLTMTSYELPRCDYYVSVLVRGKGKARLAGAEEWKEFDAQPSNSYRWIEIGQVKDANRIRVEMAPAGSVWFGGVLAEGTKQPVLPVAEAYRKIKGGAPATVILLGDSVTENWGGTGGGSSKFEKGNAGLMLQFLKDASGGEVSYLTHRDPPNWPAQREANTIPQCTLDGAAYYDGRIEMDANRRVRLINLGKGGAAANSGWSRMEDLFYEQDYWGNKAMPRPTVRFGMAHYKPDLVLINFGTNDVNGSHLKWTANDYMFHMKTLATSIQQRTGAAVILSTPHKWNRGTHQLAHLQGQMVNALRQYCAGTGFALADVYADYAMDEGDDIHPRDAGHKHIADAYIRAIQGEGAKPFPPPLAPADQLKDNGDGTVTDAKGGLMWAKDANLAGGLKTPQEAQEFLASMNKDRKLGHDDWRLPTKEELSRLIDLSQHSPALPKGHPFVNVAGWYQTAPGGWMMDLESGLLYAPGSGVKDRAGGVWPVRGAK